MADLTNLPECGVPGTHLSVRHAPDAIAALRASIARQNLTIGVDAVTGDVTLYLNALKNTYITFVTATGATQLVVLGVDRGSIEGGALGDKDFQESVLDWFDPTAALPVAPTEGDRYIATATANGWTDTYIYTYNSVAAWDELIPTEGATVEVEDENVYYSFSGTAWVRLETLIAHNLLAALQGGAASEYYHLTAAQHAALTVVAMEGVLDRFDPTAALPVAPADWDAYLATATANGWTINNCYVWDGSAWQEIVATEGLRVFVADENVIYVYDGAAWADISSVISATSVIYDPVGSTTPLVAVAVEAAIDELDANVATNTAAVVALGTENADGVLNVPILGGDTIAGTYTKAAVAGGSQTLTRTAGAGADSYQLPIPVPARSAVLKGRMLAAIVANYSVSSPGGDTPLDDVLFQVYVQTLGADGAAPTQALLGGNLDAHYDADHDTAAKRGDDTANPEFHQINMQLPVPAYLAGNEQLFLEVNVDGDFGAADVFVLTAVQALFVETLVDLA